jgi:hypothetical protein
LNRFLFLLPPWPLITASRITTGATTPPAASSTRYGLYSHSTPCPDPTTRPIRPISHTIAVPDSFLSQFVVNRAAPSADVPALLTRGQTELASLQRQVLVTNLYHTGTAFIDTDEAKSMI